MYANYSNSVKDALRVYAFSIVVCVCVCADIKKTMVKDMKNRFIEGGLGWPYNKQLWHIVANILDSDNLRVPLSTAEKIFRDSNITDAEGHKLLLEVNKANVLSLHHDADQLISFHSPLAAAYARSIAGSKNSLERKAFQEDFFS